MSLNPKVYLNMMHMSYKIYVCYKNCSPHYISIKSSSHHY